MSSLTASTHPVTPIKPDDSINWANVSASKYLPVMEWDVPLKGEIIYEDLYSKNSSSKSHPMPPKKGSLDQHQLDLIYNLMDRHYINKDEISLLSSYITTLVEDDTPKALKTLNELMTSPEDWGRMYVNSGSDFRIRRAKLLNLFATSIVQLQKDHKKLAIIEDKLLHNQPLSHEECQLIDRLKDYDKFIENFKSHEGAQNVHIDRIKRIQDFVKKHHWQEFQAGDFLFYDRQGANKYKGRTHGLKDRIAAAALETEYTQVGVFYRNTEGDAYVARVKHKYERQSLTFGQQSYIRAKRVNPSKLTTVPLSEPERLEVQKKLGKKIAHIAAKERQIQSSFVQKVTSVFDHFQSSKPTELGQVKVEDNRSMLSSEFAARALMQAIHEFNQDGGMTFGDKTVTLQSPFSPTEDLSRLNAERLLVACGPNQDSPEKADSLWEDVEAPGEKAAILPAKAAFPAASYPKRKK